MTRDDPSSARALLLRARAQVRSRSRSADYYEAGDRFSELFLGQPFQVEPDLSKTLGTDYSALDWLYEQEGQGAERALAHLEIVTERLQEMTDPEEASTALRPLHDALLKPSCEMLDVCRALVGGITVLGHAALGDRGAQELTPAWMRLWRETLWAQNRQQASLGRLVRVMRASAEERPQLLAALGAEREHLTPRATGFVAGVHAYLDRFSETAAAAVALVGGLPFSRALSRRGLAELLLRLGEDPGFLARMGRLLRLAQDVRFDSTEPLNAGVMGHVAEHRLSLLDVDAARLDREALGSRLRQTWEHAQAESRPYFDAQVASVHDETLRAALQRFVAHLHALAGRLAATGHEVRPDT